MVTVRSTGLTTVAAAAGPTVGPATSAAVAHAHLASGDAIGKLILTWS